MTFPETSARCPCCQCAQDDSTICARCRLSTADGCLNCYYRRCPACPWCDGKGYNESAGTFSFCERCHGDARLGSTPTYERFCHVCQAPTFLLEAVSVAHHAERHDECWLDIRNREVLANIARTASKEIAN